MVFELSVSRFQPQAACPRKTGDHTVGRGHPLGIDEGCRSAHPRHSGRQPGDHPLVGRDAAPGCRPHQPFRLRLADESPFQPGGKRPGADGDDLGQPPKDDWSHAGRWYQGYGGRSAAHVGSSGMAGGLGGRHGAGGTRNRGSYRQNCHPACSGECHHAARARAHRRCRLQTCVAARSGSAFTRHTAADIGEFLVCPEYGGNDT